MGLPTGELGNALPADVKVKGGEGADTRLEARARTDGWTDRREKPEWISQLNRELCAAASPLLTPDHR